jgi:MSHA biogenesis protein MshI
MHLENAEEGQALLHLEAEKSHLILFKEKTLYMMRDLDLGLNILKSLPQEETIDHISMYQDLSLEIQRSFDYCASNLQNANISRLVLTPLKEKRPQLLSNLSNILGLPVREIQYSEFLHMDEDLPHNKEGVSTFAIGAALKF